MFAQYFYALTPVAIFFGFIILISSPFLAMVALLVVAAGAVAALVRLTVLLLRTLSRSVMRERDDRRARRGLRGRLS